MKQTLIVVALLLFTTISGVCQVVIIPPPGMNRYHTYPGYTYYGGDQRNPSQYIYTEPPNTHYPTYMIDMKSGKVRSSAPYGDWTIIVPSDDDDSDD